MRRDLPNNNVSHDYKRVLNEFITGLYEKLGDNLVLVYLTGSYARGDATDRSDLDVFCVFKELNQTVLETVGVCARNTSVPYDVLEINTQSMSVEEYKSMSFEHWAECAVAELNSVLLYGEELLHPENMKETLELSYRRILADVIMGVRHYLCVDESKEKLTHQKITTYILKPLMFALRQERFCKTGVYPLSAMELLASYQDENRIPVEYFLDKEKFDRDIAKDHKAVLLKLHDLLNGLLREKRKKTEPF